MNAWHPFAPGRDHAGAVRRLVSSLAWSPALSLALALLPMPPAQARGVGRPDLPMRPSLPDTASPRAFGAGRPSELPQAAQQAQSLHDVRQKAAATLMHRYPDRIDMDPQGELIVRGELLVLAPTPTLLAAARAAGFNLAREQVFDGLESGAAVLHTPPNWAAARALQWLQLQDPTSTMDFNHLYQGSASVASSTSSPRPPTLAAAKSAARLGLIDGGVDTRHPALRHANVQRHGCNQVLPSHHGTAVASLLVGQDGDFRGVAPAAQLYAADVYCNEPTGGSAEAVAAALAWMARERVGVVNLSLVGPANRLLESVVRQMVAKGHLLVAAAGNDGPAAPPLFPAAYPGVVAVTAVDGRRRVLPEAGRGLHIAFAAPGADIAVAEAGSEGYSVVRGTSYAAPVVSGVLAASLPLPDLLRARQVLDALAQVAIDLGAPGLDPVYGHGLILPAQRLSPLQAGLPP